MTNRRLTALFLVIGNLALVSAVQAAQEIGWIDTIEGPRDQVLLLRNGKADNARLFDVVQEGDQIQIKSPAAAVKIGTGEGSGFRIDFPQSPYVMKASGKPPSIPGNLMKWLSSHFQANEKGKSLDRLASLSTRDVESSQGELVAPYLAKRFAMASGNRALYFSWKGGVAPFTVKLVNQDTGTAAFEEKKIPDRRIQTKPTTLPEGLYRLDISDTQGAVYEDLIRVVAPQQLPPAPEDIRLTTLPDRTRRLVYIAWLAAQDNGKWIIEAMQQAAELADTYRPAGELLRTLESGQEIALPKP